MKTKVTVVFIIKLLFDTIKCLKYGLKWKVVYHVHAAFVWVRESLTILLMFVYGGRDKASPEKAT